MTMKTLLVTLLLPVCLFAQAQKQWKAIQMLTARVKALEARLSKLEGVK
jgi:outer membrane lipoprotein-sorting protein